MRLQEIGGPEESFRRWLKTIFEALDITATQHMEKKIEGQVVEYTIPMVIETETQQLTRAIRQKGLEMGFTSVGFTKLEKSECGATYEEWLAKGIHTRLPVIFLC